MEEREKEERKEKWGKTGRTLWLVFIGCYVVLIAMMGYCLNVLQVWYNAFTWILRAMVVVILIRFVFLYNQERHVWKLIRTLCFMLLTFFWIFAWTDVSGIKHIYTDHVRIHMPHPDDAYGYTEEYWDNGFVYKGETERFVYQMICIVYSVRLYHGSGTLFAKKGQWRIEAKWEEGVSREGTMYDASDKVIYTGPMTFRDLKSMAEVAEQIRPYDRDRKRKNQRHLKNKRRKYAKSEDKKLPDAPRDKNGRLLEDEFHPTPEPVKRKVVAYVGKLENRLPEGEATVTYDNDDVYIGNWHKGMRQGHGRIAYANGDVYDGNWENGVRSGEGFYFTADGHEYHGSWKKGELNGLAVHYGPDRTILYNGMWEDGKAVKK